MYGYTIRSIKTVYSSILATNNRKQTFVIQLFYLIVINKYISYSYFTSVNNYYRILFHVREFTSSLSPTSWTQILPT